MLRPLELLLCIVLLLLEMLRLLVLALLAFLALLAADFDGASSPAAATAAS